MGQNIVGLLYGPPKVGKTVEMGYSFPRALFLAAPGALQSIQSTCGYTPQQREVRTIEDATKILKDPGLSAFDDLVIDDFSFMAEQTLADLEAKKVTGFKLWGRVREAVLTFRDALRFAKSNVWMNSWEVGPGRTEKGEFRRGGPQLSGNLREQVPAMCDLVLRVVHEARREPWPAVIRCSMDPNFVMGDRQDIVAQIEPAPMNLAELLRATGRTVVRRWDDQEAEVAALAAVLYNNPDRERELSGALYGKLLAAGQPRHRARWTVRDARDRALIRRDLEIAHSNFFAVAPPDAGLVPLA